MLIAVLASAALIAGVYAATRMKPRHGWLRAFLTGLGVAVGATLTVLVTLVTLRPVAIAGAASCLLAALNNYDKGRLIRATLWMSGAAVFVWCAEWSV